MRAGRTAPATPAVLVLALAAGCGSSHGPATTASGQPAAAGAPPAALVAEARPIGRGPSFQPPASGPVLGRCERRLGPRDGVHVEVFAANRVVLVPAGIGTRPPRAVSAGRISTAGCYGELVTLDPTGLVLVRPGSRPGSHRGSRRGSHPGSPPVLANLFRAWGQPLSTQRVASFSAAGGARVAVFVDGVRWRGSPGRVPLTRHAEIVLEIGPHVPPHRSYAFPPGT